MGWKVWAENRDPGGYWGVLLRVDKMEQGQQGGDPTISPTPRLACPVGRW